MNTISLGGRHVSGFSLGAVTDDAEKLALNIRRQVEEQLTAAKREKGGVFMPAWMAGASAGSSIALIVDRFGAPKWVSAVSGLGSAIGVWAGLK